MSRHPYPTNGASPTREQGGSVVVTIPRSLVNELDIEAGITPKWEWDDEAGEAVMRLAD